MGKYTFPDFSEYTVIPSICRTLPLLKWISFLKNGNTADLPGIATETLPFASPASEESIMIVISLNSANNSFTSWNSILLMESDDTPSFSKQIRAISVLSIRESQLPIRKSIHLFRNGRVVHPMVALLEMILPTAAISGSDLLPFLTEEISSFTSDYPEHQEILLEIFQEVAKPKSADAVFCER